MAKLTVKEIHERLMLYKLVRQVVEKQKREETNQPWLCNCQGDSGRDY
ncbi:MAG: hypothetical protein GXY91_00420 [Clostridia bacterium]|nr:hypothetical protein [Clostridia bacterium]